MKKQLTTIEALDAVIADMVKTKKKPLRDSFIASGEQMERGHVNSE